MSTGNERLGPTPRRFGTPMLVFVAIIGLLAGLLIGSSLSDRPAAKGLDLIGAKKVNVTTGSPSLSAGNFVELAKRVKPGVVNISTTKVIKGGGRVFRHFSPPSRERDPFRDFFGEDFFYFLQEPPSDSSQTVLRQDIYREYVTIQCASFNEYVAYNETNDFAVFFGN
jgi:S1-C subfamily serine protease